MLRFLRAPLTAAFLVAVLAACGAGPQHTAQPATTGSVPPAARPPAISSVPAPSGAPERPFLTAGSGTPAPPAGQATPSGGPGRTGTGISGQTIVINCPVDRVDPPCTGTPVRAGISVLDPATKAVVRTVDTDAQGRFQIAVPAGSYLVMAVTDGGALPRRPASIPVTVTAGHYTSVTMRLDTGLR